MSVHDETWDRPICDYCGKEISYGEKTNHLDGKCKQTKIINIKSGEKYDVYIGRAGHGQDGYYGNPFPLDKDGSREECLEKYKKYFFKRLSEDTHFRINVNKLEGKILGCFCKPKLCHGDIIKDYLDNKERYMEDIETHVHVVPAPPKKYRCAVVGSRDYNNKEKIYEYLNSKIDKVDYFVSGGCKEGADKIVDDYCREKGYEILTCWPRWRDENNVFHKGAGFIRNKTIVERSDVVIAFWTGSKGTLNTIEWAKKLGKKLIVHKVEPDKVPDIPPAEEREF